MRKIVIPLILSVIFAAGSSMVYAEEIDPETEIKEETKETVSDTSAEDDVLGTDMDEAANAKIYVNLAMEEGYTNEVRVQLYDEEDAHTAATVVFTAADEYHKEAVVDAGTYIPVISIADNDDHTLRAFTPVNECEASESTSGYLNILVGTDEFVNLYHALPAMTDTDGNGFFGVFTKEEAEKVTADRPIAGNNTGTHVSKMDPTLGNDERKNALIDDYDRKIPISATLDNSSEEYVSTSEETTEVTQKSSKKGLRPSPVLLIVILAFVMAPWLIKFRNRRK